MQLPIYPIVVVISVLALCTVFFVIYWSLREEKRFEEKEKETFRNYNRIISQAHQEARNIVENATDNASVLLSETKNTNEHIEEEVDKVFNKIAIENVTLLKKNSLDILNQQQQALVEIKTHYQEELKNIFGTIAVQTQQEFEGFKIAIKKQSTSLEEILAKQVDSELEQINMELQNYKKQKIASINDSVKTIVAHAAEEILGRTLTLDDHEKLITNALDKAMKEGIFNT